MRLGLSAPGPYDDLPCCPACGFDGGGDWEIGSYQLCEQCDWTDDPAQRENPDYDGGSNSLSLREWQAEHWDELIESHPDWRPLAQ